MNKLELNTKPNTDNHKKYTIVDGKWGEVKMNDDIINELLQVIDECEVAQRNANEVYNMILNLWNKADITYELSRETYGGDSEEALQDENKGQELTDLCNLARRTCKACEEALYKALDAHKKECKLILNR